MNINHYKTQSGKAICGNKEQSKFNKEHKLTIYLWAVSCDKCKTAIEKDKEKVAKESKRQISARPGY